MQNILVFAGCKQSGKSSAAKYIVGTQMKKAGSIKQFEIDDEGNLLVNAFYPDEDGKVKEGMGILDIYRSDFEFMKYASERIWPFCKVYSFATLLKESIILIFGLDPKNVYGTDEDKNKPTSVKWSDFSKLTGKTDVPDGYITHRQLMQVFGTDICRSLLPDCWVSGCFKQIIEEGYPNVIIDDCRYENEVDAGIKYGAKNILLTLQPFQDNHISEKIHSVSKSKFQFVIDNANMTLEQKHTELDKILIQAGWTTGVVS